MTIAIKQARSPAEQYDLSLSLDLRSKYIDKARQLIYNIGNICYRRNGAA